MNIFTIAQREINSYFRSPIAYGIMGFYALATGLMFYDAVGYFVTASLRAAQLGQSAPMNVDEQVVRIVLANSNVIFLFIIPILTMRSFAEEKRSGTMELLATSPLRDSEIILGKWIGAFVMLTTLVGLMAINLGTLYAYGTPDWHPMLAGFLGLWLEGGALLALGIFISSTTKNQIVAAAASFFTLLLLWILDWSAQFDPSPVATVLSYLAVVSHFEPFSRGVIDSKDVIYYISVTTLGLFLTARSMDSMRWRA